MSMYKSVLYRIPLNILMPSLIVIYSLHLRKGSAWNFPIVDYNYIVVSPSECSYRKLGLAMFN